MFATPSVIHFTYQTITYVPLQNIDANREYRVLAFVLVMLFV